MDEAEFETLAASALEAGLGLSPWSRFGEQMRLAFDASIVTLMAGPADGARFVDYMRTEGDDRAEAARYKTLDPSLPKSVAIAAHRLDLQPVAQIFEMIPEREFRRTEYYVDFARRAGMYHRLGFSGIRGGQRMAPLGVHRAETARPFDETDRRKLLHIKPFVKQALSLQAQFGAGLVEGAGWGALDAFPDAVLAVDGELRIVHANAAAVALCGDPASLVRSVRAAGGATVGCKRREDAAELRRLVRQVALAGQPGGAMRLGGAVIPPPGIAVRVLPLPSRLMADGSERHAVPGLALVVCQDLRRGARPEIPMARQLFGLSRSEAEIVGLLGDGLTAAQIAAERAVSEETVRTQIRGVLRKTGASSLRDLARIQALLTRSPV